MADSGVPQESDVNQDLDLRPRPDPTTLTTAQLLRETQQLQELLEAKMAQVVAVFDERFRSIDRQLELVEKQRLEQKQDTATSLDAALQAQKEAVAKTEAATTKSTDQLGNTFNTAFEGVRRELADLKERVGKIA
jgi:septal ring factor EnvC (AmiA/AmiB activator)